MATKATYVKVRPVGAGTFGKVWLIHEKNERQKMFVLKEIAVQLMKAPERRASLNEVRVLRRLRHQYVIGYRDAFCQGGKLCIIMEYAAGGDLAKRIYRQKREGLFQESKILDYFTQLSLALAYIHRKGILHRDLKSSNVFLSARDHIKIGDFGISKVLSNTEEYAKTVIGTPFYLSPEICTGRPYDQMSDMWSLGCILYELLTLKRAFFGECISGLFLHIMSGNYLEPSLTYSRETRLLLRYLLNTDPEQRYSAAMILQERILQPSLLKYMKVTDMDHIHINPHVRAAMVVGSPENGNNLHQYAQAHRTKRMPQLTGNLQNCQGPADTIWISPSKDSEMSDIGKVAQQSVLTQSQKETHVCKDTVQQITKRVQGIETSSTRRYLADQECTCEQEDNFRGSEKLNKFQQEEVVEFENFHDIQINNGITSETEVHQYDNEDERREKNCEREDLCERYVNDEMGRSETEGNYDEICKGYDQEVNHHIAYKNLSSQKQHFQNNYLPDKKMHSDKLGAKHISPYEKYINAPCYTVIDTGSPDKRQIENVEDLPHRLATDDANVENGQENDEQAVAKFMLGMATLRLQGISEKDSIFAKLEALRQFLELRLGEERMAAAYQEVYAAVNSAKTEIEDTDASALCLGDSVANVYLPLFLQLIHCELQQQRFI